MTNNKFTIIFPIIADAINQICTHKIWANRDEIAQYILDNLAKYNAASPPVFDASIDTHQGVANFVDWFSAWFTQQNEAVLPYIATFERIKLNVPTEKQAQREVWAYRPLVEKIPEEISPEELSPNIYTEGLITRIAVNQYERNLQAKKHCIDHYGAVCLVCGFDFEKVYGDIGKGFIHVHHLIPIHTIKQTYQINPITDLVPVCPNCHAMLHKKKPQPYTIEELKAITTKS